MTFDEYIANPMGKSNAVMSAGAREAQRKIYTTKFNNILLRENGKIDYYLYKGKDNTYWAHIKVPSELVPDFYYDVVLKFTGEASLAAGTTGLDKYQVQFFSNDPAFVYTYAYTFRKKGLLIKELEPRMSKKALKQEAKEKNPDNLVGYVKSIYFAYLFMKQRGLFSRLKYTSSETFSTKSLLANVENADTKIEQRQELGDKISKRKKKVIDKDLYRSAKRHGVEDSSFSGYAVKTTKNVKVVKNSAINKNANNTKRTKSTKKI